MCVNVVGSSIALKFSNNSNIGYIFAGGGGSFLLGYSVKGTYSTHEEVLNVDGRTTSGSCG
jgi:hypothetical protein